jgi:DNA mismatch repair protein MutS
LQNRLRNPRELGAIRSTIKQFPKLKNLLNDSHVPELMKFSSKISSFYELEILLNKALSESLPTDLTTGGYIKDGYVVTSGDGTILSPYKIN